MSCRITHVFQVVVFASGPDTFLRSDCPGVASLFFPQEKALELDHPCIGKEERRVIPGDER